MMIKEWEEFFKFVKLRDKELDKQLREINDKHLNTNNYGNR